MLLIFMIFINYIRFSGSFYFNKHSIIPILIKKSIYIAGEALKESGQRTSKNSALILWSGKSVAEIRSYVRTRIQKLSILIQVFSFEPVII